MQWSIRKPPSFVPPTVLPAFRVKLPVGILPAMVCQIAELAHTAEAVVGWAIHSGNTGIEVAAKNRLSIDEQVAGWHKPVPELLHGGLVPKGLRERPIHGGDLETPVIADRVEPTVRDRNLVYFPVRQGMR